MLKIECSLQEFGTMVRDCKDGQCYSCIFKSVCGVDKYDSKPNIENIIDFKIVEEKENA